MTTFKSYLVKRQKKNLIRKLLVNFRFLFDCCDLQILFDSKEGRVYFGSFQESFLKRFTEALQKWKLHNYIQDKNIMWFSYFTRAY